MHARRKQSKLGCKDQESILSSTTPDPGYQWESDKLTVDTTNESQEVSPSPAGDHNDVASDVGVNFKNVGVLSIESSLFHLFHYTFLQTKHQRKSY